MDVGEVIEKVRGEIDAAIKAIESDGPASPVLLAVVKEFRRKAGKAADTVREAHGDRVMIWEAIVELDQAGDSAKAATLADTAIEYSNREMVVAAHDTIRNYKAGIGRPRGRTWPVEAIHPQDAGERAGTAIALAESAAELAVGALVAPFTGGETVPIIATVDEMLDAGVERLTHRGHRVPDGPGATGN